ncbi:hypothetical protein [Pseudaminobacter soli (ex Li et al. 2025)]|uniref:hypothetical protein n=1 Tax=Pseudaminobacter soli (ex Li et al. 2025) TaxID=1295366 RepID=UPI0015E71B7B|nr:hypothetical protein [Mesorhizobium soli]
MRSDGIETSFIENVPDGPDAERVLVDNGADVILQHTNSTAPCQVAEERGVYCFGQYSDMSTFAPTKHLCHRRQLGGPTRSAASAS